MDYYDLILCGIFLSLAAGGVLGLTTNIPVNFGVAAGGLLSAGLMYHSMFQRAPL